MGNRHDITITGYKLSRLGGVRNKQAPQNQGSWQNTKDTQEPDKANIYSCRRVHRHRVWEKMHSEWVVYSGFYA